MQGLIGKKIGMTQVYDEQGVHVPVTVIQVGPCVVVQRKNVATDGYEAVQLGFLEQKEHRVRKPQAGHFKKANVGIPRVLREVPLAPGEEAKVGDQVTVAVFEGVPYVDIIGVTKGKGFQGVVKRHQMAGGPAAHGSGFHRQPGAVGNRTWPARVFKNKRMPGHMGNTRITTQNLKVVAVRGEDHVILVRGAVPGATGSIVMVRKSIKKAAKKS
ncbi:MAG TPA: 50S ribosomal protein L3 [Kiritimatiellia bacterium]|nr:50S ribosomal protein L3 [Kiritimatiellia bacterium]